MAAPNWQNRTLFHGDNLPFLRAMNSESVDLIATDPPFNKGKDFHATPDSLAAGASFQDRWSWEQDVHQEWVDQITDDFPKVMNVIEGSRNSYGDDMGAFLCFMAVRLLEMKRVLKDTGSIYLHCDPTASHYLKELMDAVFGYKNFRNEVIWKRTSSHNRAKRWGPVHDTLLFYTGGRKFTWNRVIQPLDDEYVEKNYKYTDAKGRHSRDNLTGPGKRHGDTGLPWKGIDPTFKNRHWELPPDRALPGWFVFPQGYANLSVQERLDLLDEQGLIYWPKKRDGMPRFKRYLTKGSGAPVQDIIVDIAPLAASQKENVKYPTQKPLSLYKRLIGASSNEGDIILDPFCGCATTLVAAEKLGRYWVGIDIWNQVHNVVIDRLRKEDLLAPDGKPDGKFFHAGKIHYAIAPPQRTDDGLEAVPFLKTKLKVQEPKDRKMSRAEMVQFLLEQHGSRCQGCNRMFDDPRYLELDHNAPRSDGGINHISNRVLLCGPCNKLKSNRFTLGGLRKENKKLGYLKGV